MTDAQRKKIQDRVTFLSLGILVLLAVFLVVLGVTGLIGTIWFPVGTAILLAAYWVVSDVLGVIWQHEFEGKTEEQKKSYYIYALVDAAGLAGLIYFIADMNSTTGAIGYVVSIFLKKRFREEFLNEQSESEDDSEIDQEFESVEEIRTDESFGSVVEEAKADESFESEEE